MSMSAASSRRTASAIEPARCVTASVTCAPSVAGGSPLPHSGESTSIARSLSASSLSVTSSRSPPTRSLSSSEVPSAITRPWSITAMRSASRSASSRYCVVSSTVVPRATRSSIVSHSARRLRGSSPVVGSSRKSTGGRATRAAARSSRRRMPPE